VLHAGPSRRPCHAGSFRWVAVVSRVLGGVLVIFVLGVIAGWLANDRLFTRDLSIDREMTGSVQVVNATGANVCIIPEGKTEAEQNCSVLYQPPDRPSVKVGDRITVGVAVQRLPGGLSQELFILETNPEAGVPSPTP
jgi:hypothetical protein